MEKTQQGLGNQYWPAPLTPLQLKEPIQVCLNQTHKFILLIQLAGHQSLAEERGSSLMNYPLASHRSASDGISHP